MFRKVQIVLILLAGLSACQVIPEAEQLIPAPEGTQTAQSRSLLIEFTGFLCVNCPKAADEAGRLHDLYPDHLTVVAMHPKDNPFANTDVAKYDYTCPEADTYYRHFGGTATTPFPTGIIDFRPTFQTYSAWSTAVHASVTKPKTGKVAMELSNVDTTARTFSYSLAVSSSESQEVQVLLWLVADSVQGAQMMPDGSTNLAYTHRHMLRASLLDDPWGWSFALEGGADAIHTRIRDYKLTDSIGGEAPDMNHYSLVVVMLNAQTKELLDVTETKINTND